MSRKSQSLAGFAVTDPKAEGVGPLPVRRGGIAMTETRADVYSRITDQIAAAIAAGTTDWRLPWHHDGQSTARPMNLASKRAYRGINVLALWIAADAGGFSNGLWGTYRQWLAQGAQVRKGERGTTVVLWKQSGSQSDDDHGNDDDRPGRRVFARAFTVFNVAQVDGYAVEVMDERSEPGRFAHADAFIANLGIRTVYGGNGACYPTRRCKKYANED